MKDLSAFLTPNLDIKHDTKVYTVLPPTKDVGLKLAAISAVGMLAAGGQDYDTIPEAHRKMYESLADKDLGQLSLGEAVYQQMIDDQVPGPHIDLYAQYALYYWVYGETIADEIVASRKASAPKGKGRARSKSGPRSA